MIYQIKSEKLDVSVSSFGAELLSVKKEGRETLWQNQTGEWEGHAPILFPFCGHFGVTVDGVRYPMEMHGVAWKTEFSLIEKTENKIRFMLCDSKVTLKAYPFPFRFYAEYEAVGESLFVRFEVENIGDKPLPYSLGSHESFLLEEDVDGYQLHFEKEEDLIHLCHNEGGYLTNEKVRFGKGDHLPLPIDLLQNSNTLVLSNLQSNKIWLEKTSGEKVIEMTIDGFSNLLLWRPSGRAKMLCIEPWLNLPDYFEEDNTEFTKKEGVLLLPVNERKVYERKITYIR